MRKISFVLAMVIIAVLAVNCFAATDGEFVEWFGRYEADTYPGNDKIVVNTGEELFSSLKWVLPVTNSYLQSGEFQKDILVVFQKVEGELAAAAINSGFNALVGFKMDVKYDLKEVEANKEGYDALIISKIIFYGTPVLLK